MSDAGARLAKAALQFVGVPFRLHGRDSSRGLDCIGLLVSSLKAIGAPVSDATGYGLRNRSIEAFLPCLTQSGFFETNDRIGAGDALIAKPGPGQHHILICLGASGFVHAHAGLGRVVRTPGRCTWPIHSHYRLQHSKQE